MTTLQDLRNQRASTWAQAQEFNERHKQGETMSAEDEAAWSRALRQMDELGTQIENRERNDALEVRFRQIDQEQAEREAQRGASSTGLPAGNDGASLDDYRAAFEGFIRQGLSDLEPEARALIQQRAVDTRAQGTTSGSAGGFTVPEGFWAKVTETMKYYATVAQFAEVLTTSTGAKIPWPTNNDTSNEGALLDENTQITGQDLTFGQAELDAFMYTSRLVLVSYQLLQDSGVDIEGLIARKLGQRLGRITNRHFTVGTGSAQPQGYTVGATQGTIADISDGEWATGVAWQAFVDLIHSVDVAYRGNARFALHDLILAEVRKWRDAENRPLWIPSVAAGVPDTILGYPYFVNNFQASTAAAGDKPVYFGNFEDGFVVRNVTGGALKRLEERYADYLQVGFFGFSRHDSVVQDPSAIKYLEMAA